MSDRYDHNPQAKALTKLQRRHEVASLYQQGYTQAAIGKRLGLNQSTVSRELEVIRKLWQEEMIADFGERQAVELTKLDALEVTYWEAWQRSVGEVATKTIKSKGGEGETEKTIHLAEKVGNPAFLQGVMNCITERCKIFGLYAPQKIAPTNVAGEDAPAFGLTFVDYRADYAEPRDPSDPTPGPTGSRAAPGESEGA